MYKLTKTKIDISLNKCDVKEQNKISKILPYLTDVMSSRDKTAFLTSVSILSYSPMLRN